MRRAVCPPRSRAPRGARGERGAGSPPWYEGVRGASSHPLKKKVRGASSHPQEKERQQKISTQLFQCLIQWGMPGGMISYRHDIGAWLNAAEGHVLGAG